ncbi:MAG: efflux RND transporter periplasmic adaptor subunit [Pseudomonadales bacterium]
MAVLVLVLMGCDGNDDAARGNNDRAVTVDATQVVTATLEEWVRGVGTVRALEQVTLRAETAGRIRAIHFEEGAVVEEGAVLFQLNDDRLQQQLLGQRAALRMAEIRAEEAKRTLDRQRDLLARELVSQDEFDRMQANLDSARAEAERAAAEVAVIEEEIAEMRLAAPFPGVMSTREVDRGAYVGVGDALATLYRTDPMEVVFSVPERHLERLTRGQPVRLTVAAWPDEVFEGEVTFLSPAVDEATRTLTVRAEVPNPDRRLRPGQFAQASVQVAEHVDRPVVPEEALVGTREGYMVFVVADDRAQGRDVSTGIRRNGRVEITGGLDVGEWVVRSGHLRLDDGNRVVLFEDRDADNSGAAMAVGND